ILSGEPVIALNHLDPELITTIITTGDIIPARGVDNRIRIHGTSYPFQGAGVTELLESGDLTISNLEAPLLDNCPVHNEGFTFCGQSGFAKAMSDVGIDIVTMENNHVGNYGPDGINETISHLEKAGIDYATSAQLAIKSINGMKVGIIAFTGVGGQFYPQDMINKIKTAKTQVDLLIGAFHWGKEYELIPTADPGVAPDDPKQIAKLAVDAGLDLIIGNHPHWVQGAEMLNESLVTYAHGNFI